MKRLRNNVTAWLIVLLVFAQGVTFAHACPATHLPGRALAQQATPDTAMPPDCPDRTLHPATSTRNACIAHCVAGGSCEEHAQAMLAVALRDTATWTLPAPPPPAAAPPPRLRYARFLI